jgi:hypothetical protein
MKQLVEEQLDIFCLFVPTIESATYTKMVLTVILGGISTFYPTLFMVYTGKYISRKSLQFEGASEHLHAQASDEAGTYLISK